MFGGLSNSLLTPAELPLLLTGSAGAAKPGDGRVDADTEEERSERVGRVAAEARDGDEERSPSGNAGREQGLREQPESRERDQQDQECRHDGFKPGERDIAPWLDEIGLRAT